MLIGILILMLLQLAGQRAGMPKADRDRFMTYITHSMFLSMLCTSVFSLPQSRYLSDAIYEHRTERVLPAVTGSLLCALAAALPMMGAVLFFSGTAPATSVLILMVTAVLCACWILMNDLSLVRDYGQIVAAFCASLAVAAAAMLILERTGAITVQGMLFVVFLSYSAVDVWLYAILYRGFPLDSGDPFAFLGTARAYPALTLLGFLSTASLLGHFFVAWHLNGTATEGLFRLNLNYDFPAISAYFTTIPAMVYFTILFETNFSERYHAYLQALGQGGSTADVHRARGEMIGAVRYGLRVYQAIQLVSTLLAVTAGAKLLDVLNIGMTEQMLDRFRMFCVAYAFYAIANILLLLQLYFMNERRALWSAALYALCAAGFTVAEIRLSGDTSGIAFVLASAICLLVNAQQLVHCLSHLEHHILCGIPFAQAPQPRLCLRQAERRVLRLPISARNAVHGSLAGACAVLLLFSGAQLGGQAYRQSRILLTVPEATDALLASPWMGYAPWANSDEGEATDSTLVYVELRWADWEPSEGVYDTAFVEQEFRLDTYREQGRKVVFRFICDEPTPEEHIDIPEWLFGQTGDGDWYHNEYGYGYSPNYENELLIQAHSRAIAALGDAYGEDWFFAFVELGSLGHWGEYHVNYEVGIRRLPTYDTRLRYITPYLAAFPHAKFLTRYPLLETRKYGFGLYNDMTGDTTETEYWLQQMQGGIWEQTELPEQADCQDSWRTSPIGGEFASSHTDRYFLVTELPNTLELLQRSHQSFIGPKIIVNESAEDFSAASGAIQRLLGYRYRVSQVTVDRSGAEQVRFRLDWCNDGVAPVYEDARLTLSVRELGGGPVWSTELPLALRTLTDGTLTVTAELPRDLLDDDTSYELTVFVTAGEEELRLPLALADESPEGWYSVAVFRCD